MVLLEEKGPLELMYSLLNNDNTFFFFVLRMCSLVYERTYVAIGMYV